jgi:two-component system sensor histidine kinase RegB
MTVRAEIASSPAAPGSSKPAAKSGLPSRGTVRLRALVLIRWAAVAGQFLTAAIVHWGLGFDLPVLAVGGTIALSALLNLTVSLGRPARLAQRSKTCSPSASSRRIKRPQSRSPLPRSTAPW